MEACQRQGIAGMVVLSTRLESLWSNMQADISGTNGALNRLVSHLTDVVTGDVQVRAALADVQVRAGRHHPPVDSGEPSDAFVNVVREHQEQQSVLFAGAPLSIPPQVEVPKINVPNLSDLYASTVGQAVITPAKDKIGLKRQHSTISRASTLSEQAVEEVTALLETSEPVPKNRHFRGLVRHTLTFYSL